MRLNTLKLQKAQTFIIEENQTEAICSYHVFEKTINIIGQFSNCYVMFPCKQEDQRAEFKYGSTLIMLNLITILFCLLTKLF